MLNQNYTVVGCKKNCRIALGAHSNPMCQVHEEFRCIVLVDEGKVNYSDPPFLNRFEKQLLRFDDIIDNEQKEVIQLVEEWVQEFSCIVGLSFSKHHAFLGLNPATIPSLVYQLTEFGRKNFSEVIDELQAGVVMACFTGCCVEVVAVKALQKGF
jgi:hypothetical protein